MNLNEYITQKSNLFIQRLQSESNITSVNDVDWGWENYVYTSNNFRQAHIERYFEPHIMVLHITVFPHKNSTHPIFGFDLICYPKKNIIGAAFLDVSPTHTNLEWNPPKFGEDYNLPIWTKGIFSDKFVACIPAKDDYESLIDFAYTMFDKTLCNLNSSDWITENERDIKRIVEKQNMYCQRQSQNERTLGALKAKVGEQRAKYFMDNILFPKVNDTNNPI